MKSLQGLFLCDARGERLAPPAGGLLLCPPVRQSFLNTLNAYFSTFQFSWHPQVEKAARLRYNSAKGGERGMKRLCAMDFTISRVNAHAQYWREGDSFGQYMATPRSEHGIMLLAGCDARFVLEAGEVIEGRRGELVYLPKGARYAVYFSQCDDERVRCLLINFQLADEEGREFDLGRLGPVAFLRPFEAEGAVARLVEMYRSPRYAPGAVKGALYALLVELSEKAARRQVPEAFAGVEKGRQYIEEHWMEETRLSEVAKMCLMSESGFRKRFHEYVGCSPAQYRLNLRIEQAKRLLPSESATVSDVAIAVGIEDVNYFSRLFRKKTGLTPSQYKRGDLC